ncbi:MAG: DUF3617 family protein [Phenylobacterium sp.]
MRTYGWIVAAGLLALAGCDKPVEEGEAARKPGLWIQQIDVAKGFSVVNRVCIDEATDATVRWTGDLARLEGCEKTITRHDNELKFKVVCDRGSEGKTSTSGLLTGDLDSAYRVSARRRTTGAADQARNVLTDISVRAQWSGACPAGLAPGQIQSVSAVDR